MWAALVWVSLQLERILYRNTAQSVFFQNLSKMLAVFRSIDSVFYYVMLGSTSALCVLSSFGFSVLQKRALQIEYIH